MKGQRGKGVLNKRKSSTHHQGLYHLGTTITGQNRNIMAPSHHQGKGLHHQSKRLHLHHHQELIQAVTITEHHGSKAMIKQSSSCASTRPISNKGSTTSSRATSSHHHHSYCQYIIIVISARDHQVCGPSPYAISIRGPSSGSPTCP